MASPFDVTSGRLRCADVGARFARSFVRSFVPFRGLLLFRSSRRVAGEGSHGVDRALQFAAALLEGFDFLFETVDRLLDVIAHENLSRGSDHSA